MTETEIEALKSAYRKIAEARIEKWEGLRHEGMVVRAKADAVTGLGMLSDAIEATHSPAAAVFKPSNSARGSDQLAELTPDALADRLDGYRDYGNPSGLNDVLEDAANRLRDIL